MPSAVDVVLDLIGRKPHSGPIPFWIAVAISGMGGLLGGLAVVVVMVRLPTDLGGLGSNILEYSPFPSLLGGAFGGIAMCGASLIVHKRKVHSWPKAVTVIGMIVVGGWLLYQTHVSAGHGSTNEFARFFLHGGIASVCAVILIDFADVQSFLQILAGSIIPSGMGLLGFAALTRNQSKQAILLFVCTTAYLATILLVLRLYREWARQTDSFSREDNIQGSR